VECYGDADTHIERIGRPRTLHPPHYRVLNPIVGLAIVKVIFGNYHGRVGFYCSEQPADMTVAVTMPIQCGEYLQLSSGFQNCLTNSSTYHRVTMNNLFSNWNILYTRVSADHSHVKMLDGHQDAGVISHLTPG